MILLLILSSIMFAILTMFTLFSESATTVTFCTAILMLFFSVLSGFQFAEAYTEVQIVKGVLKNPTLYGRREVEIVNENIRHMKDHKLYYFGLGIGRIKEIEIFTFDGVDYFKEADK